MFFEKIKVIILFILCLLFTFFCQRQSNPLSVLHTYLNSFPIEEDPISIVTDKNNGNIYIASHNEINLYNFRGIFINNLVDLSSLTQGQFDSYYLIDITNDNDQYFYLLTDPNSQANASFKGSSILIFKNNGDFEKELLIDKFSDLHSPDAIAYHDNHLYFSGRQFLRKLSLKTGQYTDYTLPFNKNNFINFPYIHISDMAINSKGFIYLVGQASFNNNMIGCHITTINPINTQLVTRYSRGKTEIIAAGLNHPGITIDNRERLYLTNSYYKKIEIYTSTCELKSEIDLQIDAGDQLFPTGVAVYHHYLYVLDEFRDRILIYKN